MENRTKLIMLIIIAIIIIVFTYKVYAPYSIQQFNAVNLKNIKSINNSISGDSFSFVVLGNIENSISIFDKKILKKLQSHRPDFIVSTGNNVVDSGEGKYRVFYRTLQRMKIPFVTGIGENEIKDDGFKNFYKYFGPFYFSFAVKDAYFIFLDTTGQSSDNWQHEWLAKQLEISSEYNRCFVFMNKPPLEINTDNYFLGEKVKYIEDQEQRRYYQDIFSRYQVTAVFSSNLEVYHQQRIKGVNYFVSGGAGGELIVGSPDSFYHFLTVEVNPANINYGMERLDSSPGIFIKLLVNIWVALQSFLYTNYLNIIIIALIVFMAGFLFYRELNREVNYYPDFIGTEGTYERKHLKIAMFTNTYFPVIGGVPISIDRLSRGLRELGHQVYIFAPRYRGNDNNGVEQDINRCSFLYYFSKEGMDMPITNIFSKEIENKFKEIDIDIVHCHHPFWLGSKGLSLGQKYGLPVVFTYHTRLEKYSHYLPGFLFIKKLFENRISHLIIRRFANRCSAIFAPTESTRKYLHNIGVKRPVSVLPTGVELSDYNCHEAQNLGLLKQKYMEGNGTLLLTVSRLSREKNLYFLLDGLAVIREKTDQHFKCLIIGDGSEKGDIKDYIKDRNLQDYVTLMGAIDYHAISKYYLLSDIFVFASTTETQGMVLLEAMAGSTPVVAVRSSGIDDVIENGFNGYKTKEDVNQWAEMVIKLMENNQLLEELSANAREMAEHYSVQNMASKAEKVYLKLDSAIK